jgi:hypothetical protein
VQTHEGSVLRRKKRKRAILSNRHCGPVGKARSVNRDREHKKQVGTMKGMEGATALVLTLAMAVPAMAGQARASFNVSAVVPVRVTLTALDEPSELDLSAADLERGYKEVSATYRVSHNDRRGYVLSLSPRIGVTWEVEVQGLAATLVMREESVEIVQPGSPGSQELALAFRFVLDPAAQPGRYALPVLVTARPL